MSEETRTVEETVDQTASNEAEAPTEDQPTQTAEDLEPEMESTAESVEAQEDAVDEDADEEAEAVPSTEVAAEDQAGERAETPGGETEAEGDDDGKHVVYLSVGQEVEGTVKRTTDFGAFVDIGAGRDGLIHISELSVGRVSKVTDVVNEGQKVTAWIKKLDRRRNRISLTLIPPGTKTIKDLQEGEVVSGTVSKIMPYGAFVDIGVGTDGLLHIREMSTGYVNKPEDVVKTGEELEVRIIGVDRRRRRIDLSLKGLRDEEPEAAEAEFVAQASEEEDVVEDPYADVDVLSPMELAFKKAMEAEGVDLDVQKAAKKGRRRRKRNRAIQEEIINRTLDAMRE